MVRCIECGQVYFNHKKLAKHLIEKHDYEIKLKEKQDEQTRHLSY